MSNKDKKPNEIIESTNTKIANSTKSDKITVEQPDTKVTATTISTNNKPSIKTETPQVIKSTTNTGKSFFAVDFNVLKRVAKIRVDSSETVNNVSVDKIVVRRKRNTHPIDHTEGFPVFTVTANDLHKYATVPFEDTKIDQNINVSYRYRAFLFLSNGTVISPDIYKS